MRRSAGNLGCEKMKIMVSACLAGINCKYNGSNNQNDKVMKLFEENEVITVCPEEMGGLPTPRVPSEVVNGIVTARDGRVVDEESAFWTVSWGPITAFTTAWCREIS